MLCDSGTCERFVLHLRFVVGLVVFVSRTCSLAGAGGLPVDGRAVMRSGMR